MVVIIAVVVCCMVLALWLGVGWFVDLGDLVVV